MRRIVFVFLAALMSFSSYSGEEGGSALSPEAQQAIREVELEIQETDRALRSEQKTSRIPIEINADVRKWIRHFTGRDRARFQRFLDRGAVYRPVVERVLRENGVPIDLYYLAMIESGFTLRAKSHAGAVGPWQFIRGTGKMYGLTQNSYVDERIEIIHSTEAAARYLKNLHMAFQSWYLAMAGYNAGEGRILGAILRGGSRDFWDLVEKKKLPSETRNYVPKFLAAAIIGKNPARYGFTVSGLARHPAAESAEVPGGVRLTTLAHQSGIGVETLKTLNPHLLRGMTPPGRGNYAIWVPTGTRDRVAALKSSLAKSNAPVAKSYYRVRRGDALSEIADKHRISVSRLKRLNALKSSKIWVGQKLRVASSR